MKFKLLLIGTVLTFACVTIIPATGVVPTLVRVATPTAIPLECRIKGNVNGDGQKVYHLPGTTFYTATAISPSRGERFFCTEQDALDAGWRKSLTP